MSWLELNLPVPHVSHTVSVLELPANDWPSPTPQSLCGWHAEVLSSTSLYLPAAQGVTTSSPEHQAPAGQSAQAWRVVAVPGLVPDDVFFDHLANRRFPAGQFIRKRNELDYLQEPDVFHDVFGHVPMLTNPVFADYMEAYGKGGLRSLNYAALKNLAALYWYTVEFGLIRTDEGLRIYGAGIVSSKTESIFALEDPSPNRIGFDLERLMRTDYRIDDFQQTYFVIDSYDQLFRATVDTDFAPIYERLQGKFAHGPEDVLDRDEVITRGTQAYAKAGGRFADAS